MQRTSFLDSRTRAYLSLVGVILLSLTLAACGPPAPETPSNQTPPNQTPSSETPSGNGAQPTSALSGDIVIDGSSTVFPITEAVAEEFGILTDQKVRITVGISGTGGGFKKFCNSETQISGASRPIKVSEVELCSRTGIEFIEIPVAIDGITIMVNQNNDFVDCLTIDELHTMWAPESEGTVTHWNQVRSGWPNERIEMYAPGVDSGTFDYFTEAINGESQASRGDFTASENDNILVQGIAGGKYSVGYFGYSYYVENTDKLKAVAVDGGSGCISPNDENINNGTYAPLSRPLFIYVRLDAARAPQVREFVNYFLSDEGRQLAAEVGYIPFPDEVYDLVLERFNGGVTGTLFGGADPRKGTVAEVLRGG